MKFLFVCFSFILASLSVYSSAEQDSVLKMLKNELSKKDRYDEIKHVRIKQLKHSLNQRPLDQLKIYASLFDEYEYYKFDSAFVYGNKLLSLSLRQNDPVKINQSKVKLASLLLHAGLFKETFDYLKDIDISLLDAKTKYDFFCLKSGAYSNLAIYNSDG
ncbi:MAG: hypothetical protein EOP55_17515, partial [Sphingobacteriales bacterium]